MSAGPNLDLFCVRQSNAVPFCENYAKLYFDAKHLEKGLNRGWWNIRGSFFKKSALFSQYWTLPWISRLDPGQFIFLSVCLLCDPWSASQKYFFCHILILPVTTPEKEIKLTQISIFTILFCSLKGFYKVFIKP